jgi:hypothetical protein
MKADRARSDIKTRRTTNENNTASRRLCHCTVHTWRLSKREDSLAAAQEVDYGTICVISS